MSKRVRRELRTLSSDEWKEVVDAMWIMKTTTQKLGARKYGPLYTSYDKMTVKHFRAASDANGDTAHYGPWFPIYHRAWLLQFENSLLAINPKIEAMPYFDFTNSPLNGFTDKIFGAYVGKGELYTVTDGAFANWPISINTEALGVPSNPYGFQRHPLSVNKAPFLTRNGGSMCGQNTDFTNEEAWNYCLAAGVVDRTITSWDSCVEPVLHNPVHTTVAGSWKRDSQMSSPDSSSCAEWFGFIAPPSTAVPFTSSSGLGNFKNAYSQDCFKCPTCRLTDNPDNCMCNSTQFCGPLWTGLIPPTEGNGNDNYYYGNDKNESELDSAKSVLAPPKDIQIVGDFGDPLSSTNDPIFPFHHANIDRHFETWIRMWYNATSTQPLSSIEYFGFPTSGYVQGCNLNDVVAPADPFYNLFQHCSPTTGEAGTAMGRGGSKASGGFTCSGGGVGSAKPHTVKDILDRTTGPDAPYTYDTLLLSSSFGLSPTESPTPTPSPTPSYFDDDSREPPTLVAWSLPIARQGDIGRSRDSRSAMDFQHSARLVALTVILLAMSLSVFCLLLCCRRPRHRRAPAEEVFFLE